MSAARALGVRITGDVSDLSRALRSGVHDADTFAGKVSGGTSAAVKGLGIISAGVAVGGVAVLGKGLLDGVTKAADFESKLNVLASVTGGTGKEMAAASKLAIKLGADVGLPAVSAADAAEAMLQLGKAGFTMRQSMDAARPTLLLATAAETDAGLAAKTVTQNINAFGLKAKDTNKIVDQMAGFMNNTGTSFDAFTDSLSYVAAPAHTVGQSFKDTAAQLAILSQNGIEGSMAGTGLRQMLVRLGSENSKAGATLQELGINVIDSNGKFIGIRATIEKLQPVLAGMTSAKRLGLMKEMFGQTAMNQANILLGTSVTKYDDVTKAIGRKGQADELAAAHMKGFKGAMATLSSSLESLEIEIGLKLLPVLTRFVNWLVKELPTAVAIVTRVIEGLSKAYDEHRKEVAAALATIAQVTQSLVATIQRHWGAIMQIVDGALDVIRGVINVAMGLIRGDWGRVWQGIVQIVDGVLTLIEGVLRLAWPAIQVAAKALGQAVWDGITTLIGNIPGWLGQLLGTIPGALNAAVGLLGTAALALGQAIFTGITGLLATIGTRVAGWISDIATAITGAAGNIGTVAATLGTAIVNGIVNGVAGIAGKVMNAVHEIVPAITDWLGTVEDSAARIGSHIVTGVVGAIAGIGAKALGVINDIIPAISGWLGTVQDSAERIGARIISGVLGGLSGIGSKALNVINNVVDEVNQVAQDVWNAAERIGTRIVSGVLAGLSGLFSSLKSKIEGTIGGVLGGIDIPGLSPPEHAGAHAIGIPIAKGIVDGFAYQIKDFQPMIETELHASLTGAAAPRSGLVQPASSGGFGGGLGGGGTTINNIYQQPGETTDGLMQRLNLMVKSG